MIGSSLNSCTELKELRLAHNDIKTLPAGLSHNARLQNLDLGNNLITNWSDLKVLSSLVNLKNLNLQGNPIAEKETLARKVKKLVPNLQIFNAKPIGKARNREGDRIQGSSRNDGNKFVDRKEKQIGPAMGDKKSNKYLLLSEDINDPVDNALDLDIETDLKIKKRKRNDLPNKQTSNLEENDNGETKAKRESKSKRNGDSVPSNSEVLLANPVIEKELKHRKQKKELVMNKASDQEGNSTITGKSSKKLNRKLKQNKARIIDDGEAPFVELFATDAAETAINTVQVTDHPALPDGDAVVA